MPATVPAESARAIRLLVVIDGLRAGGAENLLNTFVPVARMAGIDTEVAYLERHQPRFDEMTAALAEHGVQARSLSVRRLLDPTAIGRIRAAVRSSQADIVHAHLEDSATLAPAAARLAGRPCVCTFHNVPEDEALRDRTKERLAVASASRSMGALFVSDAARAEFAGRYRVNERTWAVVHNGIDIESIPTEPAQLPAELGIPDGSPAVTLVAAMRTPNPRTPGMKGHAAAIDAWPRVLETVPEARLLMVGTGPHEGVLQEHARAVGVADRVVFAGFRTDTNAILRASRLAVLPSEWDALPTALIEAAACGLPAVATRVGGIPEIVADGETGTLVRPGDPDELASAIVSYLANPARAHATGERARKRAEDLFSARHWVRRLRTVYEAALTGIPAGDALRT